MAKKNIENVILGGQIKTLAKTFFKVSLNKIFLPGQSNFSCGLRKLQNKSTKSQRNVSDMVLNIDTSAISLSFCERRGSNKQLVKTPPDTGR